MLTRAKKRLLPNNDTVVAPKQTTKKRKSKRQEVEKVEKSPKENQETGQETAEQAIERLAATKPLEELAILESRLIASMFMSCGPIYGEYFKGVLRVREAIKRKQATKAETNKE